MENTLKKLVENNVPIAIVVSEQSFKNKQIDDFFNKRFDILAERTIIKSLFNSRIKEYDICDNNNNLLLIKFNSNDFDFFDTNKDLFDKTLHTADGRIYELKNNYFPEKYKKNAREIKI